MKILRIPLALLITSALLLFTVLPASADNYYLSISAVGSGSGTVTSNPSGIDCVATCSYDFPEATDVTLAADSAKGSFFAGWSGGNCSGTGVCIVHMDAIKSITATFTADGVAPTAAITYSVAGPYKSGTSVTITATFSVEMADSPVPQMSISGANTLAPVNMTKSSATVYTYLYSVGAGNGTATIAMATGTDLAENVVISAPTSGATFLVDNAPPTLAPVSIQSNNAKPGWAKVGDTVTLSFTSSESISTPVVTIAGHSASISGGPTSWTSTWIMASGDPTGVVPFSIAFSDLAGNAGSAVSTTTDASSVTFDKTAPTIGIGAPSASATRAGPLTYTVTYVDTNFDASTLAVGDITLNQTGTANGTLEVDAGSGAARTVTISSITGNGTLGITIAAATASDTAGNLAPGSDTSATFTVDNLPPTVNTTSPAQGATSISPNNPVTINWSEAVNCSTVSTSTVTISPGAWSLTSCAGSSAVFTPSGQANTTTYTVTIGTGTGVMDLVGNAMSPVQVSYTTGTPVTRFYLHNVTTTVTGTLPGSADLSSARAPTITASGAATNRDMNGTLGTAQTSAVLTTSASTTTQYNWFRRFISPPLAAQTLPSGVWTLQAGASESNTNSNMLGWYPVIAVFRPSTGATVTVLNDAMTTTTSEPGATETNISQPTSSVSGVAIQEGDVLVLELWTRNAQGAATAYTNTIFYDGTTESSTSTNAAYLNAPGMLLLDKTPPVNQDTVFAADLTVKDGATVTVASSGDASNTIWFAPAGTVIFTPGATLTTAGGTATSILAPATAGVYKLYVLDSAGNISAASIASLTVDNTAPTVTINQTSGQSDPTNASPINFAVVYSEPVSDFITGDVTLSGSAGATTATVSGSGTTYNVAVTGMTGDGTVSAVIEAGKASDVAGNANTASTSTDNSVTYATTAPSAAITYSVAGPYKSGASVTITATFNRVMADSPVPQISISGANTLPATNMVKSSTTVYTYSYNVGAGDGTATVSMSAGKDLAGNLVAHSPTSGATFTVDNTAPTVTNVSSSSANGSYTIGAAISIQVTFSEVVTVSGGTPYLALETGSTDRNATYSGGTGTNMLSFSYSVQPGDTSADLDCVANNSLVLSGATLRDAAVNNAILTLPAPAGVGSLGANKAIIIDTAAPTILITGPSALITKGNPVTFTVTYADTYFAASTLASANISLNSTGNAAGSVAVSGSGSTRTVTVNSISGNGTLGIAIAAGTASDTAGNLAPGAGPSTTFTVDTIAPGLAWVSPTPCGQPTCYYSVPNQALQLAVNAGDVSGISKVVFKRWDKVAEVWVEIRTFYDGPYSFSFDTSVLLPDWNEIHVWVYDAANNVSDSLIFLNHLPFWQSYLPFVSR
jgi:hypothetical protein